MMRRLAAAVALLASASSHAAAPPPVEQGAARAWHLIGKLQTTASLLHTTAHPDDEQGGLLAYASRRLGARTELLTLNRGEAGDNAIGDELFDALGLIRTDELLRAGEYYGLDAQYFTQAADYGFSKRLDEAFTEWDRDALLRDMVRVIRASRPLVVVSRWQGNARDGHGQHQAAGAITPAAVAAAADPARFPELAREGLRPWRVRKLYRGGARDNEHWTLRVDTGAYDPVLGSTYQNLARRGLSFQRSQNGGRYSPVAGPAPLYYARLDDPPPDKENSLFDGLDTTIGGMYRLDGTQPPPGMIEALAEVGASAAAAREAFQWTDPSASAPALARGLEVTRRARALAGESEVEYLLGVKARQFEAALVAALGLSLSAIAEPQGAGEPAGPAAEFAAPATLDAVTPGQTVSVRVTLVSPSGIPVHVVSGAIAGAGAERVVSPRFAGAAIAPDAPLSDRIAFTIAADAPLTRPYFVRATLADTRYTLAEPSAATRPFAPPAYTARIEFEAAGVRASMDTPVLRREANLPFGYELRELDVLPPVSLSLKPAVSIVPDDAGGHELTVHAEVVSNTLRDVHGTLRLELPAAWPPSPVVPFTMRAKAPPLQQAIRVSVPAGVPGISTVRLAARVDGREYRSSYDAIRHRDLPLRYLVRDASALVSSIALKTPGTIPVGYVMGVGDQIPAALEQLGARVTLLDSAALASGDLSRFATIITGTRAYAVREDLRANNRRLLEWVRGGGNMVVLYNTPEFVPAEFAPYPGELPPSAEEVSEQHAAVEILEPAHPLFTSPNRIGAADFEGWIEQRGSKFFASWDPRYVALVSSHDAGQSPQRGGWLTAAYGKGRWTYMAYALHRQVPYGIPGAYRILANLISPLPSAQ